MTKGALAARRRDLATYAKALPSLELKRQQLVLDLAAERERLAALDDEASRLREFSGAIPFAANSDVDLAEQLAIEAVHRETEVRLGIRLPVLAGIDWAAAEGRPGMPPWVEAAQEIARRATETKLRRAIAARRVALVEQALRKAVQRINLLEQVLIPQARTDIARIDGFLADTQRMAIARAKLLMSRRAREAAA